MKGNLFNKITDIRTLWKAWEKVKAKNTGPGIDNISIPYFEKVLEDNLKTLRRELENETYIPEPSRRAAIPKSSSKETRNIGIPALKDKIVQNAFKIVVEPVFEKTFLKCVYGYRPKRGPQGAVRAVDKKLKEGYLWVLNLDIDNFFDSIDHELLISLFSEKIKEEPLVRLIKLWIKMGVVSGKTWIDSVQGVPQGNVLSPLLSNIYLHPFDREITSKGFLYIRYADDFIVMCKTKEEAQRAFRDASTFLEKNLHLQLNPEEKPVQHISEGFVFLGFVFKDKQKCISTHKLQKVQEKIKETLRESHPREPGELIADLNESVTGWRQYYSLGDVSEQFQFLDNMLFYNLSAFLKRSAVIEYNPQNVRKVLNRLEFFLKKSTNEKKRLVELIIAHSQIKKPAKTPLPVAEAIEKKKSTYKTILSMGTDLVASDPGSLVEKKGRWLVVSQDGDEILKIPLIRLKNVIILSYGVNISSHIIRYCCDKHIPIHFLDYKGKSYAHIHYPVSSLLKQTNISKQSEQYSRFLYLRALLLTGKIRNQIGLLKHYRNMQGIELEFKEQYELSICGMEQIRENLENILNDDTTTPTENRIFALNKTADSFYWKAFRNLLLRFAYFPTREKYGKVDIVNTSLNFGYALLNSKIYEEILLSGSDYSLAALYKRKIVHHTPVTDLALLFRQPVVDFTVSEMFRNGEKMEVKQDYLVPPARKKLAERILNKLNGEIKWKEQKLSSLEIFRIQANAIIEFIEKGMPFEPFIYPYPGFKD